MMETGEEKNEEEKRDIGSSPSVSLFEGTAETFRDATREREMRGLERQN